MDSQASLDLFLSRLCQHLKISCVVDVGANVGQFASMLRYGGFGGQIISFEPSPGPFATLQARTASDAKWQVHQVALGSTNGSLNLKVFGDSALSSFRNPNPAAVAAWDFMLEPEASIDVPVRRLDEILPEVTSSAMSRRVFLKIDTQGWDIEVLRGAESLIHNILMLQTELSFKPLYIGQPSYRAVLPELEAMGFEVAALFPVVRDHNYSLIEADCVMVRREWEPESKDAK